MVVLYFRFVIAISRTRDAVRDKVDLRGQKFQAGRAHTSNPVTIHCTIATNPIDFVPHVRVVVSKSDSTIY